MTIRLRSGFETCIGRVESRGLIRRLHFGDLVLLQPELLDAYASGMVQAARTKPDGLGFIARKRLWQDGSGWQTAKGSATKPRKSCC